MGDDALTAWPASRLSTHATVVLTGFGLSLALSRGWPLAAGATFAFSALLVRSAGRWSGRGIFGLANAVTSLRVLLLLVVAAALPRLSDALLLILLSVAFALDAVDGMLARRFATSSAFGATFDIEADALFVLVLGWVLWRRDGVGAWVLVPGTLRYFYVLVLALFPAGGSRIRAKRPWLGRMAFLASSSCLLAAKAVRGGTGAGCAAVGTTISCLSFGHSFMCAYPGWRRWLAFASWSRASWSKPRVVRGILSTLLFLVAWSVLDLTVNVRYPSPEPPGWYFLPSLDVTILLGILGGLGMLGWKLPGVARVTLVVVLVLLRGLRIGDGIAQQSFGKLFNLYSDLPLVPELIRYAHSTFAPRTFYGGAIGTLALIALFVFALDRALAYAAWFLSRRGRVVVFLAVAAAFAVASGFVQHDARYNQRYAGAFAASIVPRVQGEVAFLINIYDHRAHNMRAIASAQEALQATPAQLDRLSGANVYLFFVESYGATVVDRPAYRAKSVPALRTAEKRLEDNGFSTASGLLTSATYGGMSWLAHATFLTGIRTDSQLGYDLLTVARPRTMARIAHQAGYRTILVAPNTTRPSRGAGFYDFDEEYARQGFDYTGPRFAWATMPDQYVLDFTRQHILARTPTPFFVAYVLVSSHAPWSEVPTMVDDWSRIGHGEVYYNHPLHRANTNWPDFSNASEPYLRSILYDFQVLSDYVVRFVKDDSLILVLGDHQPVSELTESSPSWAVPIHVISRNAEFTEPFLRRGYVPGMLPGPAAAPMESFLVDFLRDFSGGHADARVDRNHGSGT